MKIPTGAPEQSAGQIVARPGPVTGSDPDAAGAGIGRTMDQIGQQGMNIAGQMRAEAKRVETLATTAKVQNGLADLHDEIDAQLRNGQLSKTDVSTTWGERSKSIMDDAMSVVDPQYRELVNASLQNDVLRYRRSIDGMVVKRDQADIMAGGMAYFEEMQRYAARGPKEADAAIGNVRAFWSATGPQAGETPDRVAAQMQKFAEGVRFRQASDMVYADPSKALPLLKDQNNYPELDPGNRATLIQSAEISIAREQNRGQIEAERLARELEREWNAAQTVVQAGKSFAPQYAAQLTQRFKGSIYEQPLKELMADGPMNAAFAAQPVPQQTNALLGLQNKMNTGGATPEEVKLYEKLDRMQKATMADIKEDPYKAAAERGVLTRLDPLVLDQATLQEQLVRRSQAAQTVSQWAGQEVSLLRPDEAKKVGDILQAMPPKDRAGMLSGLSKVMTPGQMVAFSKQLGAKDDALAAAALLSANDARTSNGRLVSEIILTGADAAREQRVKFPGGANPTSIRAEIDKETRGAFLSEDGNRAAGDAAFTIYQGLLAEGQSPDVKQAVNLATGGIMDLNGSKFVKPWGMKDGDVLDALRKFDAPKLEAMAGGKNVVVGGKQVQVDDLAKFMPDATLGPSPIMGRYTVRVGGRLVATEAGYPLLVPLRGF